MSARYPGAVTAVVGLIPMASLAGLCLSSLGLLAHAVLEPLLPDAAPTAAAAASADEITPRVPGEPERFVAEALLAKPLFSPTRLPPAPTPVVAEAPAPVVTPPPVEEPPPAYSLRGIVATPSSRRILLRRDAQPKAVWLAEGERSAEGWMLLRVTPGEAVLSKGTREIPLRLVPKQATKSQFAFR